jgi:hypothetical protein
MDMRDALVIILAIALILGMFTLTAAAATPIQLPKVIPDKMTGPYSQGQAQLQITNPQWNMQANTPPPGNPRVFASDPRMPANNFRVTGDCGRSGGTNPDLAMVHPIPIPYPNPQQINNLQPAGNQPGQAGMNPVYNGQFQQPVLSGPGKSGMPGR